MTDLADHGVLELAQLLQARQASSREVTEAFLERIAARDGPLRAWARTNPEQALAQADAADARLSTVAVRRAGPAPPLCGMPLGLKDVIAVAGLPLTLGSDAFAGERAPRDADAWTQLRAQGAVLLGHTRTQELAWGNAPQEVANPWDHTRSPGGSSNGSAAAVACGTAPVTLGTDVGGSLRRPASACGLTTILTTAGRLSMRGIFTFDAASDHVGPLARSAIDCALLLDALTGRRAPGATTDWVDALGGGGSARPLAGRRIGVVDLAPAVAIAPPVAAAMARFEEELRELGAEVRRVAAPPPPPPERRPRPEQIAFLREQLPLRGERFSDWTRARATALLERAEEIGVARPQDAVVAHDRYRRAWDALFSDHALDAVTLPAQTRPTPLLPPAGEGGDLDRFGHAAVRSMWNLLGLPVVGVPIGLDGELGMPVGAQLAGPRWTEDRLLRIAIAYQRRTAHHLRRPGDIGKLLSPGGASSI